MIDLNAIREQPELYQRTADRKKISLSVADLLAEEQGKRHLQQQVEQCRQERNVGSEEMARLVKAGRREEAEILRAEIKRRNEKLAVLTEQLAEVTGRLQEKLLLVPNPVSADTPEGESDADNVEVRRVGELPSFAFIPLDHVELGAKHQLLDLERGVKTAGTRNYFLKGNGVLLHRAVQQLAVDLLVERGFTLLEVPLMVRGEALEHTGFFPTGKDQTFAIAGEDRWLVGTAEVPLVSNFSGEVVDVARPIKVAAASTCFRSEVGSAGRDVRGLYRVHQFAKVEQVILCAGDYALSDQLLQELLLNAEDLLRLLELPYRVVAVCAGDMSQKNHKQYDIETWMPSRGAYGETHSASNVTDFQARRANIRYRAADGKLHYCHTLNNTAVATPRILIPLLENHQQPDGSIYIPQALRKYMYGMEQLVPEQM